MTDDELAERLRTISQMLAVIAYVAAARFALEGKEREYTTSWDDHTEELANSALLTFREIEEEIEEE